MCCIQELAPILFSGAVRTQTWCYPIQTSKSGALESLLWLQEFGVSVFGLSEAGCGILVFPHMILWTVAPGLAG